MREIATVLLVVVFAGIGASLALRACRSQTDIYPRCPKCDQQMNRDLRTGRFYCPDHDGVPR